MRFKITLTPQNSSVIPINYQYELSSWIYKRIYSADNKLGSWLHKIGYQQNGKKKFRLFTFSNLFIPKYEIHNDRLKINSREVKFIVSFLPQDIPITFITGLFEKQEFSIGDKFGKANFNVKMIEKLQEPEFKEEMRFKCISSILVSEKSGNRYAKYISPESDIYSKRLKQNLLRKIESFEKHHKISLGINTKRAFEFELKTKPKSNLITIKAHTPYQSKLRGYKFDFKIKAQKELLKVGYYAGFGEKNAIGFGCCKII